MPIEGAWRPSLPCVPHPSQLCHVPAVLAPVHSPQLQADEGVRAAPRIPAVSTGMAWSPQPRNASSIHACPSPALFSLSQVLGRALLHLASQASLALMDPLSTCPKTLVSLVGGAGLLVAMAGCCAAWWVLALGGCP